MKMQCLSCFLQSRNMKKVQLFKNHFDIKNNRYISIHFNQKQEPPKSNAGYTTIYKFPYIHQLSLINRLKFYQTVATTAAVPSAFILNTIGYIDFNHVENVTYIGATLCLALYTLGLLANNFIGFIYYNANTDVIKIAYIDFWGRRTDVKMPAKDVIPPSETVFDLNSKIYVNLKRYSTKDNYRFSLRYGIVLEKEIMKQLL